MELVLDIGNSAIKGGFFEQERLVRTFRISLDLAAAGPWEATFGEHLEKATPVRAGLVSVVPAVTARIREVLLHKAGVMPTVIGPETPLPFQLAYTTPHTLGADRLAAAAAAWTLYGTGTDGTPRSVVALDAGTAVTYDVVDRSGVFRGGPIGAGPDLIRRALHQGTAQLPAVPLELPEEVIGRSTQEALQSGLMYGFLDSVNGMLSRIRSRLNEAPYVVATGGWSPLLHSHTSGINRVAPHLVLHGVRILMGL